MWMRRMGLGVAVAALVAAGTIAAQEAVKGGAQQPEKRKIVAGQPVRILEQGEPSMAEARNGLVRPGESITFDVEIKDGAQKDSEPVITFLPGDDGADVTAYLAEWGANPKIVLKGQPGFEVYFKAKSFADLQTAKAEGLEAIEFTIHFKGSTDKLHAGFVLKNR